MPKCKWCGNSLPEKEPGKFLAQLDPVDPFSNIELTKEERFAIEERMKLMEQYWQDAIERDESLDPEPYMAKQSQKNRALQEFAFAKLLHADNLICLACFKKYEERRLR